MYYIIGSGPAGISCAMALVKKGLNVTMLDYGLEIETERKAVVERMGRTDHQDWGKKDIDHLKENMEASSRGVSNKYIYGSDFPYRIDNDFICLTFDFIPHFLGFQPFH